MADFHDFVIEIANIKARMICDFPYTKKLCEDFLVDSADFDKMESCATIQYVMEIERLRKQREEGIYEDRVDVLGAEHLAIDTPYNTYMYAGLPVGAICNPGLDAFDAALYPDMAAEVKEEKDKAVVLTVISSLT